MKILNNEQVVKITNMLMITLVMANFSLVANPYYQ